MQEEISARKDDPFSVLIQALKGFSSFYFYFLASIQIYIFLGFAYVAHDEILPYTPTEMVAIEHEHFSRFLTNTPGKSKRFSLKLFSELREGF